MIKECTISIIIFGIFPVMKSNFRLMFTVWQIWAWSNEQEGRFLAWDMIWPSLPTLSLYIIIKTWIKNFPFQRIVCKNQKEQTKNSTSIFIIKTLSLSFHFKKKQVEKSLNGKKLFARSALAKKKLFSGSCLNILIYVWNWKSASWTYRLDDLASHV